MSEIMSEATDRFFQRMAALSPEQRALLELQLRKKGIQVPKAPGIAKRKPHTPEAPLSFAQQRLWFLDQFQPNSAFYNLAAVFRLDGQLNLPVMEQALNEMVRRHEIWRSTFPTRAGQAIQVIHPEHPLFLSCIDLSSLPAPVQTQEVERLATLEAQTPFNLADGPLLRVTVLKLGETQHMMLFTMHHIVSDGWSKGVLIREIATLYEAFIQGRPSPLPELAIQYADFAVWQRQWLQGTVLEQQLAYWRQQLQEAPPLLALPTNRPRPPVQTFRGQTQSILLSASLTQALKTLSQQENVTLFMTLLAAFQTLLHRYTDRTDILVGSPVANRNRTELEGLIGFFVNTLVLRTDLSGNPRFRELLHRVREVTLAAYAHEDLPFEKLVDELQPERNLSYMPLFQVMFQLQNLPPAALELPNLTLTSLEIDKQTTQCDLSLDMVEVGDQLQASIEYSTDLFDRQTIHRWLEHFQTLLTGIVAQPDRHLSELPLLTEAEQQQILVEWSGRSQKFMIEPVAEREGGIHLLFEAQADATPDAIAVAFTGQTLTYATLNQRANQLANYLQRLGVMPDVRVGIVLERSPNLLVAVLAVLKAGGAYVPLDPTHPPERLRFMLNDSQVAVLISQSSLIHTGAVLAPLLNESIPMICLDTHWQAIAQEPTANPSQRTKADQLAYVIYTSGSTGTAKGVMICHRNLVNAYCAWEAAYELRSPAVRCHLQMANFAFDVFTGDWVRALCSGGKLVLCPRDHLLAPEQLYALMRQEKVDCAEFVPAVLRHLIQYLEVSRQRLDFMRLLICGSDGWYVEEYETFRQFCGAQTRLINSFGLTEATIDSSYFEQTTASRHSEQLIPIGRPFANTAFYILDAHLQPVPIGVPGELHICGMGLARGYLNRPDLTATRFIPNPFGQDPSGDRLYKTGDLARWLTDGNLEFLGRMDAQDKIRGHRVEVAEIEAVLSQHPQVQEAVVLVRQDPPGEKRLVAYVVPQIREQEVADSLPNAVLEAAQVAHWQTIYDNEAFEAVSDQTFNISGWDSSYTGLPLPATEMQAWVNQTIARILVLQPRRILEIGCGTGLLLFRLASHCEEYWGTDFSSHALNYTRQVLQRSNPYPESVRLLHQPADCFDGLESATFDTVILNSVIQYFPSIHYLLRVLEQVVPRVQSGGSIFIGDVRNLSLLEAFHASVQLYQSPDITSRSQFRYRVQKRLEQEQELVIDPAFFLALQHHFPQIQYVHFQPKQGQDWNELTKFRYDVTLYIDAVSQPVSKQLPISWRDWQAEEWTLPKLCQWLETHQPDWLAFAHVPNLRVSADVKIVEWLSADAGLETVGDFRAAVQATGSVSGIDPEAIWNLSHTLPYDVDIHWSSGRADGSYEVVFRRHSVQTGARLGLIDRPQASIPLRPWHTYANHPLQAQQLREWMPQLRTYLKQKLPDYMVPSVWMRLDALPLTPNGKIDRRALPVPDATRPDLPDTLAAPSTAIEKTLTEIWTQVLGVEPIGVHDNFFELGGDSILSIQIIARANQAGLKLTPKQIFEAQTIAELSAIADTTQPVQAEQAVIVGDVPLTPIQQWFFEQNLPDLHHYNQAVLLEVRQPLDPVRLEAAIRHLLLHHDGLRLRLESIEAAGWQQTVAPPDQNGIDSTNLVIHVDLSALPDSEQAIALETKASELQASLNLSTGPLLRAALFDLNQIDLEQANLDRTNVSIQEPPSSHAQPSPQQRLLIIVHHLAIDGVSWRILLEDLQTAYQQICQGSPPKLPAKTTSFKQWAEQLQAYAQSAAIESEQSYWLRLAAQPSVALPVDNANGQNTIVSARRLSVFLSAAETQALLQEVPKAYNTQINDVLLAAFAQAFSESTGSSTLTIDLEGHGREDLFADLDLSRTIGWFTSLFPIQIDLNDKTEPGDILITVKEQLRQIPQRGVGYGLLRYLKCDRRSIQPLFTAPKTAISFNYFGQFDTTFSADSQFRLLPEASGLMTCSPRGHRPYLLELNGFVHQGQLWMEWTYSDQIHHRQTIERWAKSWLTTLRSLIAHCQAVPTRRYTPSDFPLTSLEQPTLDRLFSAHPDIEDLYPLSPVQQGILFHTLYAPHSSVYFDQWSCTLQGNLNLDAFRQAWQQVVDHHPVLRTAFHWQNLNQPLQTVHQHAPLSWVHLDWRHLSPASQQNQLKDFLQHDRQQRFELSHPPLMRLTLIHLEAETHQFVWSHHHLLMDGWSTPLVLKQILSLYEANQQGQMLQLPRSRPYRDYIVWLHQQNLSQAEAVWRRLLQGFTQPIALPTTAQKPSHQEHLEQNIQISIAMTAKLQILVRQHQLTMNTLIQGMWALLLHHCSGKSDVVFGATVSGRLPDLTGSDTMIGMLINTLPVRTQIMPEISLLSWLHQLQIQQAEVRQYEYMPLVKIQEWSELPSDRPLFDTIVVFQNYPIDPALRQGRCLSIDNVKAMTQNNYVLTLRVTPGEALFLQLIYDRSRFSTAIINNLLNYLSIGLSVIAEYPDVSLATIIAQLAEANRQEQQTQEAAFKTTSRQKLAMLKHRRSAPRLEDHHF